MNNFIKFFKQLFKYIFSFKTALGLLILLIILILFSDWDVRDSISLFFMFLFCPVVIPGVIMITISHFIGSFVISLLMGYFYYKNREEDTKKAIRDYIIKAKQSGMSLKEIEGNLFKVGWSIDDIEQAIKEVEFLNKIK